MDEAIHVLETQDLHLDTLRVRAFPFPESVRQFVLSHERVFLIEQNRDAQLRSLVINEFDLDPARIIAILHYDGTPITARFIARAIAEHMRGASVSAQASEQVA
jgi:2-oxoglutarate ferredoxin oxidoreductase subunit alpha